MLGSLINTAASAFGTSKDDLIATALKPAIAHYLDGIGTATDVQFDSTTKSATLTLAMQGEDRPVIVQIERYAIEPHPKGCALVVHDFSSPSHPWIAHVAKKFSPEIRVPVGVPEGIAKNIL